MTKIHAYDNDDNPIETACGRLAYKVSMEGELIESPLLFISRDWFQVTCWRCIKAWNIPPSYQLWTVVCKRIAEDQMEK